MVIHIKSQNIENNSFALEYDKVFSMPCSLRNIPRRELYLVVMHTLNI